MSPKEVVGMYDREASFGGVKVHVDPIDRERTESEDNVMAQFHEEQPLMWEYVKSHLAEKIGAVQGEIDFLDVGTGSGIWSLLVKRNIPQAKNVLAIDKSKRAVQHAKMNAERNGLEFAVREEFYNLNTAPYRSVKTIGLYPPYHIYPPEIEMKVPQHARGGVDGQQIFREQLTTANYHLAPGGSIVFNQMCMGRNGKPDFVDYIPKLVSNASLRYVNIFQPMSTAVFLERVYGDKFKEWQEQVALEHPQVFYCDGIITREVDRENAGKIAVDDEVFDHILAGTSWEDRIELHKKIAEHGV